MSQQASETDGDMEGWSRTCGETFAPTKRLVEAISAGIETGYRGDSATPPFLVSRASSFEENLPGDALGAVVFVKRASGWVAIAELEGHAPRGVYVARDTGRAIIFTMFSIEGPGHDFGILRTADGFRSVACSSLEFPEEIESPQSFLTLEDFNADAEGRGALVASGDVEVAGRSETRLFRYRTTNGGQDWSGPERLDAKPPPLPGIYAPAGSEGLDSLVEDLVKSVS